VGTQIYFVIPQIANGLIPQSQIRKFVIINPQIANFLGFPGPVRKSQIRKFAGKKQRF
jgi:hypothetical protein